MHPPPRAEKAAYAPEASDEGKVTAVLMLDLSKAFDSLDHTLLLSKLCKLGVADDALRWFTN